MPSATQNMVDTVPSERKLKPLSRTESSTLEKIFPHSPIYTGEITNEERLAEFQKLFEEPINDGGHYFGEFDPNFTGAPDYADVETGAGGLPASPWVPNPVSPGPSMNASALPEAPAGFGQTPGGSAAGGQGSRLSPKTSSELISKQTIGDYPPLDPVSRAYVIGS